MNEWKIIAMVTLILLSGFYMVGFYAEDRYVKIEKQENVAVSLTPKAERLLAEKREKEEEALAVVDMTEVLETTEAPEEENLEEKGNVALETKQEEREESYDGVEMGNNITASVSDAISRVKNVVGGLTEYDDVYEMSDEDAKDFEDTKDIEESGIEEPETEVKEIKKNLDKFQELSFVILRNTFLTMDEAGNIIIDFFRFKEVRNILVQSFNTRDPSNLSEERESNEFRGVGYEVGQISNGMFRNLSAVMGKLGSNIRQLSFVNDEADFEIEEKGDGLGVEDKPTQNSTISFNNSANPSVIMVMEEAGNIIIDFFRFETLKGSLARLFENINIPNNSNVKEKELDLPQTVSLAISYKTKEISNEAVQDLSDTLSKIATAIKGLSKIDNGYINPNTKNEVKTVLDENKTKMTKNNLRVDILATIKESEDIIIDVLKFESLRETFKEIFTKYLDSGSNKKEPAITKVSKEIGSDDEAETFSSFINSATSGLSNNPKSLLSNSIIPLDLSWIKP